MPWKERRAVEERRGFIGEWQRHEMSMAELCRRYEISRPTGYKLIKRFEAEGEAAVAERSRAPHHRPQAMGEETAERIVKLRREHPRWGPRKLRAYLMWEEGEADWPAASSIGELLGREGLTVARRRRRHTPAYSQPLGHAAAPNQVWCTDFKGWFVCGNGERCDPLTISDAYSRYVQRVRSVEKTDGPHVQGVFEAVFREYGLPEAIRSDNGPPFASVAPGGLSRLSMWWLKLGIHHERIEPGCPEQNGRHERMHQTLKQETATPPAANLRQQQERFRKFEVEYNQQRPHEALGNCPPAALYLASARVYPARLPELEYPEGVIHRRVSYSGSMRWKVERTYISEVLAGEWVGLLEIDDDLFDVYYGPLLLGWFSGAEHIFEAYRPPRHRSSRGPASDEVKHAR